MGILSFKAIFGSKESDPWQRLSGLRSCERGCQLMLIFPNTHSDVATLDLNLCNMPKYTQEEPRLIKYFSQIVQQLFPIAQIYVKSMSRMKGTRKKDFSDSEVYMTRLKIV